MNKNKHLTKDQRQTIEDMLYQRRSVSDIARSLGKCLSTITNEIKSHTVFKRTGVIGSNYNNCKKRFSCQKAAICHPCTSPRKYTFCRRCSMCNKYCSEYEQEVCSRYLKPPYVCNGCGRKGECVLEKRFYNAASADREYRLLLSESRSGISLSLEELLALDKKVSPLLKQGQSPHHVCITNRDSIMVSERTIYRLVNNRLISAMNMDLPRTVRFKPRKKKSYFKVDKCCRIDRDYIAFKSYIQEHPDAALVQLDSVEGKKGGKVLLTVHFVKCEMMLAFLRDANDSKSVTDIIEMLYEGLGPGKYKQIFSLFLTDNGSEFSNPKAIEFDTAGDSRSRVFYCDPSAPFQKGSAERNHEFIRCFIPKGTDIGRYTQTDITLMMNHINSYSRESLGGKCPYEVFRYFYGDELLTLLKCTTIPANKVTLNRSVFRKEDAV